MIKMFCFSVPQTSIERARLLPRLHRLSQPPRTHLVSQPLRIDWTWRPWLVGWWPFLFPTMSLSLHQAATPLTQLHLQSLRRPGARREIGQGSRRHGEPRRSRGVREGREMPHGMCVG